MLRQVGLVGHVAGDDRRLEAEQLAVVLDQLVIDWRRRHVDHVDVRVWEGRGTVRSEGREGRGEQGET